MGRVRMRRNHDVFGGPPGWATIRLEIFQLLERRPGLTRNEIAKEIGVSYATARYHLARLIEARVAIEIQVAQVSQFVGGGKLTYVAAADFERRDRIYLERLLEQGSNRRIFEHFARNPEATLRQAGAALGWSAPTVARSRQRLVEAGLLMRSWDSRSGRQSIRVGWDAIRVGLAHP